MTNTQQVRRPGQVVVAVSPSAFERGQHGQVVGPIVLRYEQEPDAAVEFPDPGWTDFVLVLLGWWLERVEALRGGREAEVWCEFMDGPLDFSVGFEDDETYRVRCVERTGAGEDVIAEWVSPRGPFETSLWEAGRVSLAECDRRGWAGRDVETLRRALGAATRAPAV